MIYWFRQSEPSAVRRTINGVVTLEFPLDVKASAVNPSDAGKSCEEYMISCGWAVYVPFTRVMDHYLKNACVCSPEKKCIRYMDDTRSSSFIYRCLSNEDIDLASSDIV